jgi:HD superfamily phosphohydrolase
LRLKNYNDPIYGFISIPSPLISSIIQETVVQRLRRIQQMGLSHYVFNGATHNRFAHALGAMHLMQKTLEILEKKGTLISKDEKEASLIAILLHDLGHGPFSHALEGVLIKGISHEQWSLVLMNTLNKKYNGKITLAIEMFEGKYKRPFFNQLISSQLDMDRLDYLKRDSFYSGVTEGNINTDRIVAMLRVQNEHLVVEQKGMYSIEKFLLARRLMYWSVYLHKTSFVAEEVLKRVVLRARELILNGESVDASKELIYFLNNTTTEPDSEKAIEYYASLDDVDVYAMIKAGVQHQDNVFSSLCTMIITRRLPKINVSNTRYESDFIEAKKEEISAKTGYNANELTYFVFDGKMENMAYSMEQSPIILVDKKGQENELLAGSDESNLKMLTKPVTKYYCCYPK